MTEPAPMKTRCFVSLQPIDDTLERWTIYLPGLALECAREDLAVQIPVAWRAWEKAWNERVEEIRAHSKTIREAQLTPSKNTLSLEDLEL